MISNTSIGEKAAVITTEAPLINYSRVTEYDIFLKYIDALSLRYSSFQVSSLGRTTLGRGIPVITLGGKRESAGVIYVGGMDPTDILTPPALLRFAGDYGEFLKTEKRMYGVSMPYLYEKRTVHIIPMLNPDGYFIKRNGVEGTVQEDMLKRMNGGDDFSSWRFNGRGGCLSEHFVCHNGGDNTASERTEPEIEALRAYIEMGREGVFGEIGLMVSLCVNKSGILYSSAPRAKNISRLLSRMTGCSRGPMGEREGSFSGWFTDAAGKPSVNIGCLAEGEEAPSDGDDYIKIYAALREALFSSPLLI